MPSCSPPVASSTAWLRRCISCQFPAFLPRAAANHLVQSSPVTSSQQWSEADFWALLTLSPTSTTSLDHTPGPGLFISSSHHHHRLLVSLFLYEAPSGVISFQGPSVGYFLSLAPRVRFKLLVSFFSFRLLCPPFHQRSVTVRQPRPSHISENTAPNSGHFSFSIRLPVIHSEHQPWVCLPHSCSSSGTSSSAPHPIVLSHAFMG